MSDSTTKPTPAPEEKQENTLLILGLSLVLPALLLGNRFGLLDTLGWKLGLAIAIALPVGYAIREYLEGRKQEGGVDKQENLFLNLALNIVIPAMILSKFSTDDRLGPLWALIVGISLPIGYGIFDFITRRNFNFFSALGFVSVLATGGLGLFKASPQIFAIKEATIPILFGIFILLSHLRKKPLIEELLLNPQLLDLKKLNAALDTREAWPDFRKLLFHCSLFLALTLCGSAVANYFLAMHILEGTEGGSPEYMEGIGKITWMGFLMIGLPMMVAMVGIFFFLMRGLTRITGLDSDALTTPGEPVKKKVSKGKVISEEKIEGEEG